MIHSLRARNYGCLVDVEAHLTPIHAFIGPGDSGKTTLLQALRTVVQLASDKFTKAEDGTWEPFDPYLPESFYDTTLRAGSQHSSVGCDVDGGSYTYKVAVSGEETLIEWGPGGGMSGAPPPVKGQRLATEGCLLGDSRAIDVARLLRQLASVRLVRFDPDALREPSPALAEDDDTSFLDDRGYGLASVYLAIRNRGDGAFAAIVEDARRHFPAIRGLRVKPTAGDTVALELQTTSGARVDAARISDGLVSHLAFAALRWLTPVSLLLMEKPENGLHPARIPEMMTTLRAIAKETKTQVVMVTHSARVVNQLKPDEVSVVVRRAERGTVVTRISKTPLFVERSEMYEVGDLWAAYANGEDEAPLLEGREP